MNVELWGWYSIAVNVILALINLAIATASGSLAVEAEMIHNLVDLLTAVAVLIGLKLSTRKSKDFPYGLYKLENVVAVGLAVMVPTFLYIFGNALGSGYDEVLATFSRPFPAILTALVLVVGLNHFRRGAQIMIEDYMRGMNRKIALIFVITFSYFLMACGLFALAKIAL